MKSFYSSFKPQTIENKLLHKENELLSALLDFINKSSFLDASNLKHCKYDTIVTINFVCEGTQTGHLLYFKDH